MKVELNFYIGLRDINQNMELKNTSLVSFLSDCACEHSEIAGFGMSKIFEVNRSWVLLGWKIDLKRRPKFAEKLRIVTWSNGADKLYAYRDFKIYIGDEQIGVASSKWLYIDIEAGKFVKIDGDMLESYIPEYDYVFGEDYKLGKLKEPTEYSLESTYPISNTMIDVNNHVNNIFYLAIAKDALPEEIKNGPEFNSFEVMYKKEIKYGEKIVSLYSYDEETSSHIVAIKSEDLSTLHAIISFN